MIIVLYDDNKREYFKSYILYKKYDVTINDDYLTIKNINEEILIDILKIINLKNDIISNNIANANTTRTVNGGPYKRQWLKITVENGVEIIEDMENFRYVYDPTHPDAITEGERKDYVKMPNVDILIEMVDMIETSRLYEEISKYLEYYKNVIW